MKLENVVCLRLSNNVCFVLMCIVNINRVFLKYFKNN